MCGLTFFVLAPDQHCDTSNLRDAARATSSIAHRGPDRVRVEKIADGVHAGFSRLSIVGLNRASDQPFVTSDNVVLVCNGEIYNHKFLIQKYGLVCSSDSDCEVILRMYLRYGDVAQIAGELDGVFAFVLYDARNQTLHAARDLLGIRPLFWNNNPAAPHAFASEAKAVLSHHCFRHAEQFPPGRAVTLSLRPGVRQAPKMRFMPGYHQIIGLMRPKTPQRPQLQDHVYTALRNLLHSAVRKRLMGDRPIACLLSGGLDSSLITSIVVRELGVQGIPASQINTYSIGMSGSSDLKHARIVAQFLGTDHHEVLKTEKEFIDAIPETIWTVESDDVTTVRASVGNYLVSKYIAAHSDNKIIFNGDTADEIFASYLGFSRAPSKEAFKDENARMLLNIHFFDVLRSDRSISGAGLEARTPFADKALVKYVMSLNPSHKMFDVSKHGRMEKHVLRAAFVSDSYLPASILWRRKEAFSDGVSSSSRSWHHIAQAHALTVRRAEDPGNGALFLRKKASWQDEAWWYTSLFQQKFGGRGSTFTPTPHRWVHPFGETNEDPSARQLAFYDAETENK